MKTGVVFSQADSGIDPDSIRRFAREIEAAGYHHLMAYDHILGAAPERFNGPVDKFPSAPYTIDDTFHEILILFSHLAAVTSRLEFVTSVLVLPQRQTALVAKQVATIDLLSNGRLRVVVGVGWNFAEYEGLGMEFTDRGRRLEEQIDVLRQLWMQKQVSFTGEFHDLNGVGINPRPTRTIPVWIGSGSSERLLRRVVRYGDGWLPLLIPDIEEDIEPALQRLRNIAEQEGRDPDSIPVNHRLYIRDGWQAEVERARRLGCSHLTLAHDRMTKPIAMLDEQLAEFLAIKPQLDQLLL